MYSLSRGFRLENRGLTPPGGGVPLGVFYPPPGGNIHQRLIKPPPPEKKGYLHRHLVGNRVVAILEK